MADPLNRYAVYFEKPRQIALRSEPVPVPQRDQLLVQSQLSAISPGTETLIYRGQMPKNLALDETLPGLSGDFDYPFKYGYAVVGNIISHGGPTVSPHWQERLVFAFHPHESHFIAPVDTLLPLPPNLSPEDAVFLPNMETAVTLLLDGAPLLGERVLLFGQGVVGLLTTALLAQFPLASLLTVDPDPNRREWSRRMGATRSLSPSELEQDMAQDADLIYELSGNPAALNLALPHAGYNSRLIIGSWYGTKTAAVALGNQFHRQRLQIRSSQVSTIEPALRGRWDKTRRLELAWQMLQQIQPARLISHRFPLKQAAQAYALLDQNPTPALQIVLTYD